MSKLIIIRGPSGAGKSTIAKELVKATDRPTMLVSEDALRKTFNDWKRPDHEDSKVLAIQTVLFGLSSGYDVVYEGILMRSRYDHRFKLLFEEHPDENYLFYLDVSFGETLKRHQSRPEKADFGVDEMKRWWDYASPTSHLTEKIIPESSSLAETLKTIRQVTGL
jgi:predicted kinase